MRAVKVSACQSVSKAASRNEDITAASEERVTLAPGPRSHPKPCALGFSLGIFGLSPFFLPLLCLSEFELKLLQSCISRIILV